jgi:S1-C subfamily serine protease
MNKAYTPLFLCLALVVLGVQFAEAQEFPFSSAEREILAESVVVIRTSQDDQGSGVVVSQDGLIWTNEHVVANEDTVEIWIYGGENNSPIRSYIAEVIETSSILDFALLQITSDINGRSVSTSTLDLTAITPTNTNVSQGDSVFLFGYPLIAEGVLNISPGIITAIPTRSYGQIYKSNAEFAPGASGSLVVNVNGEMIGIASRDRTDGSGRLVDIVPVITTCSNLPLVCPNVEVSQTQEQILFVSDRSGRQSIYSMNSDGSNLFRFATLPANSSYPQWSPSATRLLFHSDYRIYSVEYDGTNLTQLTDTGLDEYGHWSPDGSQIVFHSWRDGELEIYVMDSDGSNIRQLTSNNVDDGFPRWSPDGERILFQRDANGERGNADIFIINVDGSNERRITNDQVWDWVPKWSPDGSQIVFMSFDGRDWEIFTISATGNNRRQLTNNNTDDFDPDWSPDGSQIVFTQGRWNNSADEQNEIVVMNSDGSNVRVLTNDNFVDGQPSWR